MCAAATTTAWRQGRRHRCPLIIACLWASAGCLQSIAPATPPFSLTEQPVGEHQDRDLPTLRRMVRHFDFEEAEVAPHQMPLNFYRFGGSDGAGAQGFPPFGSMGLTDEAAYSGRWSFGFELDGGSLSARVPTAVIPVVPLADYLVTARVRTSGIQHARARLAAWMHDRDGRVLADTRTVSRLVATDGEWDVLSVEVLGRHETASDLVVELQLLQPRQFLQEDASPEDLLLEDVTGWAWFDDVTIWHLPRVDMYADHPVHGGEDPPAPTVTVLVRDLARKDLNATLQVYDLDGGEVFSRTFPAPRMPRPRTVRIPLPASGWYRAVLDVYSRTELTARSAIDLVALPTRDGRRRVDPADRFAVALREGWQRHAESIPALLRDLGVGTVILPVLDQRMKEDAQEDSIAAIRRTIDELRADDLRLIPSLESVPSDLGKRFDLTSSDVLEMLSLPPDTWRGYLHDLLANYAFEMVEWQVGATGRGDAFWESRLDEHVRNAERALSAFVPGPLLYLPFTADQHPESGLGARGVTLTIPSAAHPESIPAMLEGWAAVADRLIVLLELPPRDVYTPRQRVADLTFRTLQAWRSEAGKLAIVEPWTWNEERAPIVTPDPTYPVWQQLSRHLGGRHFAGELALGEGIRCWILHGATPLDSALVAWCEGNGCQAISDIQLAEGPVRVFDLFGNRRDISLGRRGHAVRLGELPVFIEDINIGLVRFRGGFALEPAFIPAEHQVHEHEIVLRNPWDVSISGTIRLPEPEQWSIQPRSIDFAIGPQDEVRLPVQIVVDRSVIAGPRRLEANIELQADAPYRLAMQTQIEIGLRNIDVTSSWRVARNVQSGEDDLVVTLYVTNKGSRAINLDAFLMAPNVSQQRRIIAGLQAGEMGIRMFQIPGGAALLSGESIRVGVTERDGTARLTQILDIPHVARESRDAFGHTDNQP